MKISIQQALHYLKIGEVIAAPTEAVYGLSVDPYQRAAIERLLQLKQRDPKKGLILVAGNLCQLDAWVDWSQLSPQQQQAVRARWPGPFTWVVPAKAGVFPLLRGEFATLAVRVTAHPVMRELCLACGHAVVSTSANLSGHNPAKTMAEVEQQFGQLFPILEGGLGSSAQPTEILDAKTLQKFR